MPKKISRRRSIRKLRRKRIIRSKKSRRKLSRSKSKNRIRRSMKGGSSPKKKRKIWNIMTELNVITSGGEKFKIPAINSQANAEKLLEDQLAGTFLVRNVSEEEKRKFSDVYAMLSVRTTTTRNPIVHKFIIETGGEYTFSGSSRKQCSDEAYRTTPQIYPAPLQRHKCSFKSLDDLINYYQTTKEKIDNRETKLEIDTNLKYNLSTFSVEEGESAYGQISAFSGEEKAKLTNIHNVAHDMYEDVAAHPARYPWMDGGLTPPEDIINALRTEFTDMDEDAVNNYWNMTKEEANVAVKKMGAGSFIIRQSSADDAIAEVTALIRVGQGIPFFVHLRIKEINGTIYSNASKSVKKIEGKDWGEYITNLKSALAEIKSTGTLGGGGRRSMRRLRSRIRTTNRRIKKRKNSRKKRKNSRKSQRK